MSHAFREIGFTGAVKALQTERGSRAAYARGEEGPRRAHLLTDRERAFIAARDSFYIATVSETGWPYVQHRGGPTGFVKILDERTLAFADYGGNQQYMTVGNLRGDERVSLILVDYPRRSRLKVFGRAQWVLAQEDEALLARVLDRAYPTSPEHVLVVRVEGYDWNCSQHITPRFSEADLEERVRPLRARVDELEAALAAAARALEGVRAAAEGPPEPGRPEAKSAGEAAPRESSGSA